MPGTSFNTRPPGAIAGGRGSHAPWLPSRPPGEEAAEAAAMHHCLARQCQGNTPAPRRPSPGGTRPDRPEAIRTDRQEPRPQRQDLNTLNKIKLQSMRLSFEMVEVEVMLEVELVVQVVEAVLVVVESRHQRAMASDYKAPPQWLQQRLQLWGDGPAQRYSSRL
ncbi:unnamed protein product [Gadus morhua 'NCC']